MPVIPDPAAVVPAPGGTAPCGWVVNPGCCSGWGDYPEAVRAAAEAYATGLVWALTGRQFGVCQVTVRPCGSRCRTGGWETFPVQTDGAYGTPAWGGMTPYSWNGTWRNCACPGACSCDARCEVWLPGPVASVTDVYVDGVLLPDTAYRVDAGGILVRTDGDCWPECQDLDLSDPADAGTFFVTYGRGRPVPLGGDVVVGIVACEFAKYCAGAECRLPRQLTSLTRQGVEITVPDFSEAINAGLTGIPEVDAWIRAYNPARKAQRARVFSPDVRGPRQVTL